jgi:hypothetical protein
MLRYCIIKMLKLRPMEFTCLYFGFAECRATKVASKALNRELIMQIDSPLGTSLASLKAGVGAAVAMVVLCFLAAFFLSAPLERSANAKILESASGEAAVRAFSGRNDDRETPLPF